MSTEYRLVLYGGAIAIVLAAVLILLLRFRDAKRHRELARHREELCALKKRTRQMYELLLVKAKNHDLDSPPLPYWPEGSPSVDERTAEVLFPFSFRRGLVQATLNSSGTVDVKAWNFTAKHFSSDSPNVVKELDEYLTLVLGYHDPEASSILEGETSDAPTVDEAATAKQVTVGSSPRN